MKMTDIMQLFYSYCADKSCISTKSDKSHMSTILNNC